MKTIADKIKSKIESTINDSSCTVLVDYVPDYSLSDLANRHIVIVPVGYGVENLTRGKKVKNFTFEIGLIQRIDSEDDVEECLKVVEDVSYELLNFKDSDWIIRELTVPQFYNPLEFKQSRKITSVIRILVREY